MRCADDLGDVAETTLSAELVGHSTQLLELRDRQPLSADDHAQVLFPGTRDEEAGHGRHDQQQPR
jgi:hypothetical protein